MKYLAVALLFAMNSGVYACDRNYSYGFYKRIPDKSVLVYQDELLKRIPKYDTHGYYNWYRAFFGDLPMQYAKAPRKNAKLVLLQGSLTDKKPPHLVGAYYNLRARKDEPDRQQLIDQHSLTLSEREDILLLINLVIDDNTKANQILDELYAQYRQKLVNAPSDSQRFWCVTSADVWHNEIKFHLEGTTPTQDKNVNALLWFEIR